MVVGFLLCGWVSVCIDVFDGLFVDFGYLCMVSVVGVEIELDWLLLFFVLFGSCDEVVVYDYVLVGGDDYELCFMVLFVLVGEV